MLRNALSRLRGGRHASPAAEVEGGTGPARARLPLPPELSTSLGYDAVGVPARHGFHLMSHLPRTGCVFEAEDVWWWIVPAGSDQDLDWPEPVAYAAGGYVPVPRPRLIHGPDSRTPYTPPIPLFLMVCQVAGVTPSWGAPGRLRAVTAP
ncbi:hypothetical protein [Streptomyces sp. NBC_00102]|uniref:hypothetical protein n=1 Tax=Streptomyces sp. NBC_00102 TaxID=2975652 RepID=UPI0022595EC3|nr:hypothetical protein [Streptomyces sp. NBC_00102]MCX5401004.1 hypothetical protein [Streptomyces sp. NBC_00102]